MVKPHVHRFVAELDKSVIGLTNAWFFGHCENCSVRIDKKYLPVSLLERYGEGPCIRYYLNEERLNEIRSK